jgi:hypothetical protein
LYNPNHDITITVANDTPSNPSVTMAGTSNSICHPDHHAPIRPAKTIAIVPTPNRLPRIWTDVLDAAAVVTG